MSWTNGSLVLDAESSMFYIFANATNDAYFHFQWIAALFGVAGPWVLRFVRRDLQARDDLFSVLLIFLWKNRYAFSTSLEKLQLLPHFTLGSAFQLACSVSVGFAGAELLSARQPHNAEDMARSDDAILKPRLFPCRTTHTRLFPTSHSFSYSYLLAGIPVGWRGIAGRGLSADVTKYPSTISITKTKAWFNVEGEDYLERESSPATLQAKLDSYLRSEGLDLTEYPFAYLLTAPRFLGFSFNPISFWYLYSQEGILKAMILEVNNTFDERRIYFLGRSTKTFEAAAATQTEAAQRLERNEGYISFRRTWSKDFHVSPFNSRDGSYSVAARDPFFPNLRGPGKVDNTIVLRSAEGKAKLVARIFSEGPPVAPDSMSRLETLRFVASWCWVGFATNPRILRQAWSLWWKKLQVFYRPEVLRSSIGRHETREETVLERSFSVLLKDCVAQSKSPVRVRYLAAAGPNRGVTQLLENTKLDGEADFIDTMELRILTPAFYSNLVKAGSLYQSLRHMCYDSADHEQVFWTTNRETLISLFEVAREPLSTCSKDALLASRKIWLVDMVALGLPQLFQLFALIAKFTSFWLSASTSSCLVHHHVQRAEASILKTLVLSLGCSTVHIWHFLSGYIGS